jgi:hypothetical protein
MELLKDLDRKVPRGPGASWKPTPGRGLPAPGLVGLELLGKIGDEKWVGQGVALIVDPKEVEREL